MMRTSPLILAALLVVSLPLETTSVSTAHAMKSRRARRGKAKARRIRQVKRARNAPTKRLANARQSGNGRRKPGRVARLALRAQQAQAPAAKRASQTRNTRLDAIILRDKSPIETASLSLKRRQVESKLWQQLRRLGLIGPILNNSVRSGAPQYLQENSLPNTSANYEKAYPKLKLYGVIRVLPDNSSFLDIHAKFQPKEGAKIDGSPELGDYNTKVMLSHFIRSNGLPSRTSARGLGDNARRAAREYSDSHPDSDAERTVSNAWDGATQKIWSVVSEQERMQIVDVLFAEAASNIHLGPISPANYTPEKVMKQREFVKRFQKARTEGRLTFRFHGEYAGLFVEPQE